MLFRQSKCQQIISIIALSIIKVKNQFQQFMLTSNVNSHCQQTVSGIDVNRKKPHLVLHPIGFPQLPQKLLLLGVVKKTDKMSMRKNERMAKDAKTITLPWQR